MVKKENVIKYIDAWIGVGLMLVAYEEERQEHQFGMLFHFIDELLESLRISLGLPEEINEILMSTNECEGYKEVEEVVLRYFNM